MNRQGIYKQHALAHLLGVQESTITRWKNDKAISVDHAIALCEALVISLDWFLCGIGPIGRPSTSDDYDTESSSSPSAFEEGFAPFWSDRTVLPSGFSAYVM